MTIVSRPSAVSVPAQRSGAAPRLEGYRRFTAAVLHACERDPGARAALRSGLGKDLDAMPRMHRVIAHLVPSAASEDTQRAYYAVAAVIAEQARRRGPAGDDGAEVTVGEVGRADGEEEPRPHPTPSTEGGQDGQDGRPDYGTSLGVSFALAVVGSPGRERQMRRGTAESRLNILCKQGVLGLHRHLPASVRYLRSLDVPVDWARLLQDLVDWREQSGRVKRRWLQDFYRRCQEDARREADRNDNDVQESAGADGDA
ncbi:type I-E CRISPR-associated protein Cse2/CasB [Streptomyces sp. BK340]|uniref:type I-E CRISPR-associated protein Cse2/CasB n=1 Tax=Streptomyces sp. BK340 TaxID=2572903 RepID=UPI0011ABC051|nr:type I-E CRISPR-associated protein Cse2/CasB [Streptomyces sp. BK340]TVZ90483.1 CRISPR system Cascade subunit CasB [Streptomyces sp. BK340]